MEPTLPETDRDVLARRVARLRRHQARLMVIYDCASFAGPYDDGMAAGACRLWFRCQKRIDAMESGNSPLVP